MIAVIGLGAGGHAKVVIDSLRLMGGYDLIGLLDPDPLLQGTHVAGIPVLGDDQLLPGLWQQGVQHGVMALGSVGSTALRRRLYETLQRQGWQFISVIHPRSLIASTAQLGQGCIVLAQAVINPAARLGDNVIVNTGAIVEHDCWIGDHVHVATGARLGGGVRVEAGAHIGLGASILQGVQIQAESIIGAGAVVIEDVPAKVVMVGVPARVLKRIDESWSNSHSF